MSGDVLPSLCNIFAFFINRSCSHRNDKLWEKYFKTTVSTGRCIIGRQTKTKTFNSWKKPQLEPVNRCRCQLEMTSLRLLYGILVVLSVLSVLSVLRKLKLFCHAAVLNDDLCVDDGHCKATIPLFISPCVSKTSIKAKQLSYQVVIDAGSTGSRIHIFTFRRTLAGKCIYICYILYFMCKCLCLKRLFF